MGQVIRNTHSFAGQAWGKCLLALALTCSCRAAAPPEAGARFAADPPGLVVVEGGTLNFHVESEPPTLNPLVEHDTWTSWIARGPIYETLVRFDEASGALKPGLALAWENPQPTKLLIKLRPNVRWHDAKPFTCDDVVFTLERTRQAGALPEIRNDFENIEGVKCISPLELILHLKRPDPLLPSHLAMLSMLPAHGFSAGDLRMQPASRAPVGTGPFRFVSWRPGEEIILERNPAYWSAPAHLARIVFRIVRDRAAAYELGRRGEIDLLWRLDPSQLARAQNDPLLNGWRLVGWHPLVYSFIIWNTTRPGLGDARVRQALTLATDQTRYLKNAYAGRALPVTGPYPIKSPSYNTSLPLWPYDLNRSRALLDAAGIIDHDRDGMREINGQPFRLTFLLIAGSRPLEQLATMLQEDLRRIGIILDVQPCEWAVLLDRLRRHAFDATALLWTMPPLQDNFPQFHSTQAVNGQNYGSFSDTRVDRLLEKLHDLPLGPERFQLEHELHRLLYELQPCTFLGTPEIDSLLAPKVHGFSPNTESLQLDKVWLAPSKSQVRP